MDSRNDKVAQLEVVVASLNRRLDQSVKQLKKQSEDITKLKRLRAIADDRSTSNFVIIIPFLIACFYQAYSLTEVYLKYDVTAEALFFPTDPIIPPMATVCMTSNQSKNVIIDSRQVFNETIQFDGLVGFVSLKYPYGALVTPSRYFMKRWNTFSFMISKQMCHPIDLEEIGKYFDTRFIYTFIKSRAASHHQMLHVVAHGDQCNATHRCSVTISSPGNYVIKQGGGIPIQAKTTVSIYYEKQELSLQPPPYTTNCFDYTPIGIQNQDDCIHKCIKRESLKIDNLLEEIAEIRNWTRNKYGVSYDEPNITSADLNYSTQTFSLVPEYVPVFRHEHYKVDTFSQIELFPRLELCKSRCYRVPCKFVQYSTSIRRFTPLKEKHSVHAKFVVKIPQNGELKVFYKPKVTMVEYFTLFGSVFSLWFGISALQLVTRLTQCLKKIINK